MGTRARGSLQRNGSPAGWEEGTAMRSEDRAPVAERDVAALRREVDQVDWWHTIDLGDGIVTPGRGGSPQLLERIRMPDDMTGRTVLDIGTFDGAVAFEAERRGAKRVVAVDHRVPPGFLVAHRALNSSVEFQEADVHRLDPERLGVFDIVFYLDVIYHLPNPMASLERVRGVTGDTMILETEGALDWMETPAAQFVGSADAMRDSALNWWYPNMPCLTAMVQAAGFGRVEPVAGPPPAPRTFAGRLMRRLRHRHSRFSPRLVVHAWV